MEDNGNKPPSSQDALRRLLIVLAIVVGITIYSYGWTVTNVDLEKPQEERRQTSVQNALRELLSPRIFTQERDFQEITANFRVVCDGSEIQQPDYDDDGPSMRISQDCGESGDEVTVGIFNFEPLGDTRIRWIPPEGQSRPREVLELGREEIELDADGNFTGTIEVPRISGSDEQINQILVRVGVPSGPIEFSDITRQVFLRMVETIFMALLATSIAIPIAGFISFFAARNLMRPIRFSMGNMLTAFIAFAVGFAVLGVGYDVIGGLGFDIGSAGELTNPDFLFDADDPTDISPIIAIIVPIVVIVAGFFGLQFLRTLTSQASQGATPTFEQHIFSGVNLLLMLALIIFILGTVSGWFVMIGDEIHSFGESLRPDSVDTYIAESQTEYAELPPDVWASNAVSDAVEALGTVPNIFGTTISLLMPVIAGVIAGFGFASVMTNITSAPLRLIPDLPGRAIAGVLGFIAGGILLMLMGQLGMQVALFGLFPPFVAAMLGGQVTTLLYKIVTNSNNLSPYEPRNPFIFYGGKLVFWVGAGAVFIYTFNQLNITRALVDGTLPPDADGILGMTRYVSDSAVIGAILGGIAGLLSGLQSNFPIGNTVYNISRAILNTIRSVEPLIMGLVFVVWVGIGPFAGVLALTLHSVAALGKLYSEQIENIDPGPIEAIRSTGAGWLQMVNYSVVPQIVPPYIAFTMYRWDINVRMSTIIGFVGGGGIGLLLNQQINLLRYRDAGVAVLAIAIVVSILDYASALIRERLI